MRPINLTTSFRELKINFDEFLGSGKFGYVFGIIERPQEERGFFSEWFPFIYDFIFRPKAKVQSRDCVKIAKPFLQILFEEIRAGNEFFLANPVNSLFAMRKDINRNALLNQYKLSKIKFKQIPYSVYSQVQTKVNGFTLHDLARENSFINPDLFEMRQSFVTFLIKIKYVPLLMTDIHRHNVMYDVDRKEWEIIDGDVRVENRVSEEELKDEINWLMNDILRNLPNYQDQAKVFDAIRDCVLKNEHYTESLDKKLMQKMKCQ